MPSPEEVWDELQLLLDEFADACYSAWFDHDGDYNEGQLALIAAHVFPAIDEWGASVAEEWPWGPGSNEYWDAVYGCYDSAVIEQAFSMVIEEPIAEMDSIQALAQAEDIFFDIF